MLNMVLCTHFQFTLLDKVLQGELNDNQHIHRRIFQGQANLIPILSFLIPQVIQLSLLVYISALFIELVVHLVFSPLL